MWNKAASHYHAGAWLSWLAAAMLGALSTRNPFYLALIIAIALAVAGFLNRTPVSGTGEYSAQSNPDTTGRGRGVLIRAVLGLTVIVALFKGLSFHVGTNVLFSLPEGWPVIGGPITLESMVSSGLDALSLLAMLTVFSTFSAGADYYAILRSVPPFLHQVAMVSSIAITFVPQTVVRFTEIREAQSLRGHKVRRVRDLLPLIMPLLSGGMERSINLAEAMEARGFGRYAVNNGRLKPVTAQIGLIIGLGIILIGGTLLTTDSKMYLAGWGTIATGVGIVGLTLRAMGRGARHSRYRRSRWRDSDTLLAAFSIGTIAFLITYKLLVPPALLYNPFPSVKPPGVDIVLALGLLGLTAPIFGLSKHAHKTGQKG